MSAKRAPFAFEAKRPKLRRDRGDKFVKRLATSRRTQPDHPRPLPIAEAIQEQFERRVCDAIERRVEVSQSGNLHIAEKLESDVELLRGNGPPIANRPDTRTGYLPGKPRGRPKGHEKALFSLA